MDTRAMETIRTRGVTWNWYWERRDGLRRRAVRATAIAGIAATGLLLTACASSSSSSSPSSAAAPATSAAAPASSPAAAPSAPAAATATLKTESSKLGTVLANSQGMTLYWFAADHGTKSACSGACATAWPPVIGMPQAMAGVTLSGKLGTITRSDGTMQATYNGHPLYTFKGDSSAGQVNGNLINGFGAAWYATTIGASSARY